ncbi:MULTISPECIES: non-ribosomal peptide synthetase [Actinoplanes]|uniref:non-ribosomal peptide synthetase n=1 Tax=Actinoplanes TaxID=1865 RepID=UPI0005F2820F|nr:MULTISPECIES: non-ribosomal peptide synthetase [Actinoplanes]GLY02715.1 hypothetical protein Acsp01_30940 [Actinoplanes sp. NBRC 101535]
MADPEYAEPVLPTQHEIWHLDRYEGSRTALHVVSVWRLTGRLDVTALAAAVDTVVASHESLRSVFDDRDGRPSLRILPPDSDLLRIAGPADCTDVTAAVERLVEEPFDLSTGPLFRSTLLQMGPDENVLVMVLHHIVADAWSLGLVEQQLADAYRAVVAGSPPKPQVRRPLRELIGECLSERDTPAWQTALDHWRHRLDGVPTSFDLPSTPTPDGFGGSTLLRALPAVLTEDVRLFARVHRLTNAKVFLTACAALLARWANSRDFVIGMPFADRARAGVDQTVAFLTNVAPIRVTVREDPTFRELAAQVEGRCDEVLAHRAVPLADVLRVVRTAGDGNGVSLTDVVFTHRRDPGGRLSLPGVEVEAFPVDIPHTLYGLAVQMEESGTAIAVRLDSRTIARPELDRLCDRYVTLLAAAVADPDTPLSALPILLPDERWVATGRPDDDVVRTEPARTLAATITRDAMRTPGRVAVRDRDGTLTYWQFLTQARRICHRLREDGVRPGDVVGVCAERDRYLVSALFGILLAGGVYLPLDRDWPSARLTAVLADAGARRVLCSATSAHQLGARALLIDAVATAGPAPPVDESRLDGAAYIMYTSGSTGRPKGVLVGHRALAEVMAEMARLTGMTAGERMLASTTTTFDISLIEILLPLVTGATVVMADDEQVQDPASLGGLIDREEVDVVQATPSVWAVLDPPARRLRAALCGGETMSAEVRDRLLTIAEQAWNWYGPTEATIWATGWRVEHGGPVSIGRPMRHVRAWVLDEWNRPCPPATPGMLVLGGTGIAEGYLNRPDQTALLFRTDLVPHSPRERAYITGDSAVWSAEAMLSLRGRADDQVKISGHRIELGEVESTLRRVPGVRDVAVVRFDGHAGRAALAAFVVPDGTLVPAALSTRLQEELDAELPVYMRPRVVLPIDELPRLPSGKLDRPRLAATVTPERIGTGAETVDRIPVDPVRIRLGAIWTGILGIEPVPEQADFFRLGGDSLGAAQALALAGRAFGVRLSLRDFLAEPTLGTMARLIDTARPADAR